MSSCFSYPLHHKNRKSRPPAAGSTRHIHTIIPQAMPASTEEEEEEEEEEEGTVVGTGTGAGAAAGGCGGASFARGSTRHGGASSS